MQFRSDRKKRETGSVLLVAVGALVLLFVIVFNNYIVRVASSFVVFSESVGYEHLPRNILASRLKDAEEELSRIRYQALLYTHEVEKNAQLTHILGLPNTEVFARGEVFSRPPKTHYDTLLVSVPENTPLTVGDEAFVSDILIGTIQKITGTVVLVSLYSSPGTVLDVEVGEPRAITVMRGLGAGGFWFEIPKEVSISLGDRVVSSHNGELIAVVQHIIDEPERTTRTVHAASPIATSDMRVIEFVQAREE